MQTADDYERPGHPVDYSLSGPESELTDEARAFFADLDSRYWAPMRPDRFGRTVRHPTGTMPAKEVEKVWVLVAKHRLPTQIGCGMCGLPGYSMAVYDSPGPQGETVGDPKLLFLVMSTHMPWSDETRGADHQRDWIAFTRLTHSPDNLRLLDYYGMDRPGPRHKYDY